MKHILLLIGVLGCGGGDPTGLTAKVAADVVGVYDLSTDRVFRYGLPGCFFNGVEGTDSVTIGPFATLDLQADSSFNVAWERYRHCYTSQGDSPLWWDTLRAVGTFTTRGALLDSIAFIYPITTDLIGIALRDELAEPTVDRIGLTVDEHHFPPYEMEFTRR